MTALRPIHSAYNHGVLVHDGDDDLVDGTRAFVAQGLTAGGEVLVVGNRDRVSMLQEAVGAHPRVEYALTEDLYHSPMRTLFAYQRRMEERAKPSGVWVTGPVPLGHDAEEQSAWNRYESAVNEALSAYPFRAMCTYDRRTRPESVIAAARATHPTVNVNHTRRPSPEYVDPTAFLADPLAQPPHPPTAKPTTTTTITHPDALRAARHLLKAGARSHSAVAPQTIEQFLVAVHEVAANGLFHGRPPVHLSLWADLTTLTCLVDDSGTGGLDPISGYRFPGETEPMGLWAARQLVDDLLIGDAPSGGCRVQLTMADGHLGAVAFETS